MDRRKLLLLGPALALAPFTLAQAAAAPALMLADVYRRGMPLADYWVSEKYDGMRGYWDGKQLWTRGGERVAAPAWFTAPLPAVPMDGELWAGRGRGRSARRRRPGPRPRGSRRGGSARRRRPPRGSCRSP